MIIPFQGSGRTVKDPNICPHCHVTNIPYEKWKIVTKDTDNADISISTWLCANSECSKLFVVSHKWQNGQFIFHRFLNGLPKGPNWPKPILELKNGRTINLEKPEQSKFTKTYLQSLEAENLGLDELAGMGYRKAIEYLVKDWAIQAYPDDQEKIKDLWLGVIIKGYYQGDLKDILERATWLGNDQAHYNKLFEEFELDILKDLIELIMVELDTQHKKAHYIRTIQSRK